MFDLVYRGKPLTTWRIEEIAELAAAEPWRPVGDQTIPGPLSGLHAEMQAFGAATVGDLRPGRVLAAAVLLGVVTVDEASVLSKEYVEGDESG